MNPRAKRKRRVEHLIESHLMSELKPAPQVVCGLRSAQRSQRQREALEFLSPVRRRSNLTPKHRAS